MRTARSRLAGGDPLHVRAVGRRRGAGAGGIEVGVYVLVAPEPDRQQPHDRDELYIVLDGRGTLEVEGEQVNLKEGEAAFVPAGADHRFIGYEGLSVLVIFAGDSPA